MPAPRHRRFRIVALVITGALGIVVACEDSVYVYSGRRYNADGACLEAYKPIEVVPGSSVDLCRPTCFSVGSDTFVSALCPPLPANATQLPRDAAACARALKLFDATCGEETPEDAGEEEQPPEEDASPVDAARRDAAADG
jgi:hypothetical protein